MRPSPPLCLSAALLSLGASARATTKGLNQIPTPDIQLAGVLSLSVQQVHPAIDNATQFQTELGLTRRFEVATVQGFAPGEFRLGMEYGLLTRSPALLSVGFLNWTTRGGAPQAFVEAGDYHSHYQFMAGALRAGGQTEGIVGATYTLSPSVLLSADYQAGAQSFATAGVTFTWAQGANSLVFNPALYVSNDSGHPAYGYAVLTYNIRLWK